MKIYQTTIRSFCLNPVTNNVYADAIDITDDIILHTDMNDALCEHKKRAEFYGNDDIFNVTNNDNKIHIENDDISLSNIIEIVTDECIIKIVIETITREI